MERVLNYVQVSRGIKKADLVLKNAWVVDVFNQCIQRMDVAITGDRIAGIGKYQGEKEINCEGLYVAPGLIDAHVHIESSKVIPEVFSKLLIKNGVTACIADPHEIANVLGRDGIEFMLENSKRAAMDIFFMMPSCVPAVDFEDNGALLDGECLEGFIGNPRVLGLGEVMDVPAVVNQREDIMIKLSKFKNLIIDGHCPGIDIHWLNAYIYAGVGTDHECISLEEVNEKIGRGMYVMLREGSAAKNLSKLLPAVGDGNYSRFLFCTDDKDIIDIHEEGSINYNVKTAVKQGMNPVRALTIASLNAAQCYGLRDRGAVAPGYLADLVIFKDIESFEISNVIFKGRICSEGTLEVSDINEVSSMNIEHVDREVFRIRAKTDRINVIKTIKDSICTERVEREAIVSRGIVAGIKNSRVLKIAVFERHRRTGKYGVGYIEGIGIRNCSVAQTIAHDSHNIIVAGDDDGDMAAAVNRVIDIGGGIVIVSGGRIIGEVSLPVGGLMTGESPQTVIRKLNRMKNIIKQFGERETEEIFITLSFMSLPVIPEIKLTARGLYDYRLGGFIDLFCS